MAIRVELYGIPRDRAGASSALADGQRLGDILTELGRQFPRLAADCFSGRELRAGYVANVNGERFVTDPDTALNPGDALLILSADAGG